MGCSASSDALDQLRHSLHKLNSENINLAEAISTEYSTLADSFNTIEREQELSVEILQTIQLLQEGTNIESRNPEISKTIPQNLSNLNQFLQHKLDQTVVQRSFFDYLESLLINYKSLLLARSSDASTESLSLEKTIDKLLDLNKLPVQSFKERVFKSGFRQLSYLKSKLTKLPCSDALERWKRFTNSSVKRPARSQTFDMNIMKSLLLSFDEMQEVEHNVILKTLFSHHLLNQKPTSPLSMYRFLEEVLDKKHEQDFKDLSEYKKPQHMAEFMMIHMNSAFGEGKFALKSLSQIISTMSQQRQQEKPYTMWFCRVFQIYHPEPLPHCLAVYITKIRVGFSGLVEKYDKMRLTQGKIPSGYRSKAKGKEALEAAERGGLAYISDIVDYVHMQMDKRIGVELLERIKPSDLTITRYAMFRIYLKLKNLGITPDAFFQSIDINNSGNVSKEDIACKVMALDVWISEKSIEIFCASFAKKYKEIISKEQFLAKFSPTLITFFNQSDSLVVSKSQFLIKLTDICMELYYLDADALSRNFGSAKVNLQEFSSVIKQLTPELEPENVIKLVEEAKNGRIAFDVASAVTVLLDYHIGINCLAPISSPETRRVLIHSLNF